MKKENELWKTLVAYVLVATFILSSPFEALAQSNSSRSNLLENGTQLVLRIDENFKSDNKADSGNIHSIVDNDVYSADGSRILIAAGTPAYIEFNADPNGSWGKAGKICLTHASTKTVDNKRVQLRLSSCKSGSGKLGGVIALSVIFFPLGLISGCMKGSMPKIQEGTTFNASVMQDIAVE